MTHFVQQRDDPAINEKHSTLVDFTELTFNDLFIQEDELNSAIHYSGQHPKRLKANKVALVYSDSAILPFIEKSQEFCSSVGEKVNIFNSIDSASIWLNEA